MSLAAFADWILWFNTTVLSCAGPFKRFKISRWISASLLTKTHMIKYQTPVQGDCRISAHSYSRSLARLVISQVFISNEKMNQHYEAALPLSREQEEWHITDNLNVISICSQWSWCVVKVPLSPWNVTARPWPNAMEDCQSNCSFRTNQINGNKAGIHWDLHACVMPI